MLSLWWLIAVAQVPPPQLAAPGIRVELRIHEAMEPDRLRALARPNVRLVLETQSNTLRESTVDSLKRFPDAFVQIRAPLKPVDSRVFSRIPSTGLAVDAVDAPTLAGKLPGARRLRVRLPEAPTDADFDAVERARPMLTWWKPGPDFDVLAFGRLRQLSNRKVVATASFDVFKAACARPAADSIVPELDVALLLTFGTESLPCASGTRVVIRPNLDRTILQMLVLKEPRLELVAAVSDDQVRPMRLLLDDLGLTASR